MANYAISDGSRIINVIVADSKEIAEQATGMTAIETFGEPWIDWTLEEEGWRPPKPYASWIWSGNNWSAPIPIPEDNMYTYTWNEELMNWEKHDAPRPFLSWTRNENGEWSPPIPYPEDDKIYSWNENIQQWVLIEE